MSGSRSRRRRAGRPFDEARTQEVVISRSCGKAGWYSQWDKVRVRLDVVRPAKVTAAYPLLGMAH